jgi:hypothetical protein
MNVPQAPAATSPEAKPQAGGNEQEEETKEDTSCQGRFLDEYMKNAEVDPTLIVSKPDRTLMVSRGKIPEYSTNIYRKSSNDDEAPASLMVAAGSLSSHSQRGVSVASDYSMLSFGSVLSDEEEEEEADRPEEDDCSDKNAMKRNAMMRNPVQTKSVGIRLPSSGLVSNEWRKKLAISPTVTSHATTWTSRLGLQLTEFLDKEIRKLKKEKSSEATAEAVPPPATPATPAPADENAEKEKIFHSAEQRLAVYDAAMDLFVRSPEMRQYRRCVFFFSFFLLFSTSP